MAWFNSRKGVLDKESSRKSADELDLNETAQLICLSRIELQEAIRKGTAPPYRVNGRSIHWIRAEVEAWMAEQS